MLNTSHKLRRAFGNVMAGAGMVLLPFGVLKHTLSEAHGDTEPDEIIQDYAQNPAPWNNAAQVSKAGFKTPDEEEAQRIAEAVYGGTMAARDLGVFAPDVILNEITPRVNALFSLQGQLRADMGKAWISVMEIAGGANLVDVNHYMRQRIALPELSDIVMDNAPFIREVGMKDDGMQYLLNPQGGAFTDWVILARESARQRIMQTLKSGYTIARVADDMRAEAQQAQALKQARPKVLTP